jgi:hypothetical protein
VRGFADQRLRNPKDPLDASNRRISIIVQYLTSEGADDATGEGEGGKGSEGTAKKQEGDAQEGGQHATAEKP